MLFEVHSAAIWSIPMPTLGILPIALVFQGQPLAFKGIQGWFIKGSTRVVILGAVLTSSSEVWTRNWPEFPRKVIIALKTGLYFYQARYSCQVCHC